MKRALFGILILFTILISLALVVGRQNEDKYNSNLVKFKAACAVKHRTAQWRRFTGWYCADPNSVDFFE